MKKIRKKNSTYKVIFASMIALIMVGAGNFVFAANTATQEASTGQATTISVVGKVADTDVTTITFPQGAPNDTISAPYNDVDTSSDPQFLDGAASEPVVRLRNTAGVTYNVTLEIDTWTNGVAASEDYELVDTTTTTVNSVASVLSADGNAASVATGVSMGTGTYQALYLELVLSAVANKTGTSTLTVLGETA